MDTGKAIVIAGFIIGLAIIVSPVILYKYKMSECTKYLADHACAEYNG